MPLGPLLRSLSHTRPRQVARRAWLVAKRRALAAAIPASRARAAAVAATIPAIAERLPPPVLPARTRWVERGKGGLAVRFFEIARPLTPPIDWHPAELPHNAHLWKMHLHLMEYLEGLEDDELSRTIADWIERNPPYGPRYWAYDWNSFTVAIRTVVWMQQLALRGVRVSAAARARMGGSLVAQLRFLAANLETDLGGNHLLKDLKALLWAGAFFRGEEALRWRRRGAELLSRELDEQILPDGMHFERSASYHAQVFADLLECRGVIGERGPRDRLDAVLARMAQALVDLTHPGGLPSLFNDAGHHSAYSAAACLQAWKAMGGTSVAPRAVFALSDAGYFGARDRGSFVLADCGPIAPDHLPAHGHGDILSFEWTLSGQPIVVDAGVFEYAAGPRRAESRSTRAHNTVTIADEDQCEFHGSFRVGRRARPVVRCFEPRADGFTLEGTHDGYRRLAGAPTHRRRFEAAAERIEVTDVVERGAGQPVVARLLLHPDCRVARGAGGLEIEARGVRALLTTSAPFRIEDAFQSPDFGARLATVRILLDYGAAPCKGGFRLEKVF